MGFWESWFFSGGFREGGSVFAYGSAEVCAAPHRKGASYEIFAGR